MPRKFLTFHFFRDGKKVDRFGPHDFTAGARLILDARKRGQGDVYYIRELPPNEQADDILAVLSVDGRILTIDGRAYICDLGSKDEWVEYTRGDVTIRVELHPCVNDLHRGDEPLYVPSRNLVFRRLPGTFNRVSFGSND